MKSCSFYIKDYYIIVYTDIVATINYRTAVVYKVGFKSVDDLEIGIVLVNL